MIVCVYVCVLFCDVDIDECVEQPCSSDAICQNNDGDFTCTCKILEGYVGDGFTCNRTY